jgi:hypothetical protein
MDIESLCYLIYPTLYIDTISQVNDAVLLKRHEAETVCHGRSWRQVGCSGYQRNGLRISKYYTVGQRLMKNDPAYFDHISNAALYLFQKEGITIHDETCIFDALHPCLNELQSISFAGNSPMAQHEGDGL